MELHLTDTPPDEPSTGESPTGQACGGFTPAQWEEMIEAGLRTLERAARARRTLSYTELCESIGRATGLVLEADGLALHVLLERIARRSYARLGVVLTALVRRKGAGYDPGGGFYAVCRSLGLLDGRRSRRAQEAFVIEHQRSIDARYAGRRGPLAPVA